MHERRVKQMSSPYLLGLEQQNRGVTEVEVDEVLRLWIGGQFAAVYPLKSEHAYRG
jgi:hypothetical protein